MPADANELMARVSEFIINPLIYLLFAAGLALFFWGGFQFIANAGGDEGRETGRRHMLYGVLGMLFMASVFAILQILARTFGLEGTPIVNDLLF